ncbi:ABC transporter permease [uncultured Trichococcus sp.]|uniref:ABC transporter permease n=1 Tax=uncultured Trichococcus sp. TaxID=189665 RepID=UPI0029C884B6|nr:ABC transporter permease [uncultured Trichococcus sp.]
MMVALRGNKFIQTRSDTLSLLFALGAIVVGVFSFIFILYTNSFLIKRRKKEIGLYAILGMKKSHVSRILAIESIVTSFFSIAVGLMIGHLLGELAFLVLNYALKFGIEISFPFTIQAMLIAIGLFALIFLTTLVYNITQVTFSNPIQLIKGKQTGEREPKSSLILFILSLLLIGSGYWMSLTIDNPLDAMIYFFLAVLLVIAGTYFLFISGSIFILKKLKKNKQLYYRPSPFISISGMLYRMKQNAVGLANITILATMVIVAVSTTAAIFIGTEDTLTVRLPYENQRTYYEPVDLEEQLEAIEKETETNGLKVTGTEMYVYYNLFSIIEDNKIMIGESDFAKEIPDTVQLLVKEDYERIADETIQLQSDEVLIFDSKNRFDFSTLLIGDTTYQVEAKIENPLKMDKSQSPNMIVVVDSKENLESIIETDFRSRGVELPIVADAVISWDTTGTQEQKKDYSDKMAANVSDSDNSYFQSRELMREEWNTMNGGFLFLGIFLGVLFTFGAALITYFKQVSEGYDDREKFQIMQKVGLDKQMIRKTTRLQIVWMFLLPLIIAVTHVTFAFPIIQKLLLLFSVVNTALVFWCFIGVIVGFSVIYWIIYQVTSKVYYSIVE